MADSRIIDDWKMALKKHRHTNLIIDNKEHISVPDYPVICPSRNRWMPYFLGKIPFKRKGKL
uniref:Uncharacterized protein n=1 Tax=Oryza brachyantha TaxID=4533 RepID=J3M3L6_ORYBR